ncbi:MAG: DUF3822 family protein [Saprospiraceae bacterium]|jgi:hypothetical protein|nr:DUF3822 family protein [Saprospiraceae bacterium]MBP9193516.1 DUF3822 family protein [Saprospiraceae bacterium]
MIQIDFSSDFIDKDIAKLSVISDADSFVYGLFDQQQCLLHRGKLTTESAARFIKDWQQKGVSVHYMSPSVAFTHLPVNEDNEFNKPQVYCDQWVGENVVCYYEDAVNNNFNWDYKHVTTASFQYYSQKSGKIIWLHFLDQSIQIACFEDGKFKFYNQFDIQTAEDVIYYLFAISRQVLQTEPDNIQVEFSGQLTVNSSFYQLLFRYIKNLKAVHQAEFQTKNEDLADHIYFDHFLNIQSYAHH